ncbi:acyl-CoA dehydrogenase family protein [Streptomyces sp. Li-HN-5-11]|uniref:acyl-CoA dehydrogenase family protein n=1 Tax=Streptomyces sp. Li-HN-5-11 TaxID=3075432 RepID=UPI0028B1F31F|nr:acyl-CoA dehydrogenase family protein [Streptomyces sp. Li-HN-5-11]WNM31385.1 acyl-CoA dehydrogenase family protein [Streptomyces sp. Li-HN-5-11]
MGSKQALMVGALHQPRTPEGRELLEIIAGQLPGIEAAAARHDREGTFPADIFKSLTDAGVLRATVPRELGGLGLGSVHDVCLAVMRLAEADPSVALCLHMQLSRGLTMSYELAHGTETGRGLAERILRLMGTQDAVVSGALKDAGPTTRLVQSADGGWTLHGRKILVSMAPVASHFVVQAETRPLTGQPRLASVFVAAAAEGLSVPDNWDGMGMRASASSEVVFEGCSVPEADVFLRGTVGVRNDAALAGQAVSSIGLLGVYAGIAQASRDIAVRAAARHKGPVSSGVRTLLAELDVKLYCLRATLAAALDNTDHYAHRTLDDPAERGRVMMAPFQFAKLTVNRNASAIVEDAMTVVGGASFTSGHPLSRRYRDVRAGWFMQPYTYGDAIDFLSGRSLEA